MYSRSVLWISAREMTCAPALHCTMPEDAPSKGGRVCIRFQRAPNTKKKAAETQPSLASRSVVLSWGPSGGLAAASPPVGQPHSTLRRCGGSRPGSGWDRVGPPRSGPRAPRIGPGATQQLGRSDQPVLPGGNKANAGWSGCRGTESTKTVLGHEHGSAPVGCPPSTCRLATGSSSRGLTRVTDGDTRLAEGFPLRCFQRFARPNVATQRCRLPDNWSTSGSSSPVLSY